jgi:hypothetical protein
MRTSRTLLTATALAAILTATTLTVASPAQAVLPTCTIRAQVASRYPGTYVFVPAVPGNYAPSINCLLRRGNSGEAVRVLQASLAAILDRNLAVDGVFGPITETAVRDVQRLYRISVDGVYGPQTRQAMCWLTISGDRCDWLN